MHVPIFNDNLINNNISFVHHLCMQVVFAFLLLCLKFVVHIDQCIEQNVMFPVSNIFLHDWSMPEFSWVSIVGKRPSHLLDALVEMLRVQIKTRSDFNVQHWRVGPWIWLYYFNCIKASVSILNAFVLASGVDGVILERIVIRGMHINFPL